MNLSIETLAKGKKELEELREIRATSLARVVTSIRQVSSALFISVVLYDLLNNFCRFVVYKIVNHHRNNEIGNEVQTNRIEYDRKE